MQAPRDELTADASPPGALPGEQRNLRAADWLFRSRAASVLWLVARLWLGYGWRRPRELRRARRVNHWPSVPV